MRTVSLIAMGKLRLNNRSPQSIGKRLAKRQRKGIDASMVAGLKALPSELSLKLLQFFVRNSEYIQNVENIIGAIQEGDIFQTNLSNRYSASLSPEFRQLVVDRIIAEMT